jgi:hypothetical protein
VRLTDGQAELKVPRNLDCAAEGADRPENVTVVVADVRAA